MNKNIKISVVMSIYSEPIEWISEAIDSILNQTFSDFEFIIINDKPDRKENSILLSKYQRKDNRIVVISNEENIGLTKSLNKGLKIAKGKYIARMDADDISMPARFEKQYDLMEHNANIIVCGTNIKYFGERNNSVKYPYQNDDFFIFIQTPFAHPTVMFRGDIIKNNNVLYNESYRYAQDYEFWNRISSLGDFYNIQEILLNYRVDKKQISRKKIKEQQVFAGNVRRVAFDNFCSKRGFGFKLPAEITIETIKEIKRIIEREDLEKKEQDAIRQFIYYLYRSIKEYRFHGFLYLIYSFDFFRLGVRNFFKVLVCLLLPNKYAPVVK